MLEWTSVSEDGRRISIPTEASAEETYKDLASGMDEVGGGCINPADASHGVVGQRNNCA